MNWTLKNSSDLDMRNIVYNLGREVREVGREARLVGIGWGRAFQIKVTTHAEV